MKPTHIREGNLLYSCLLIEMLIPSRNTLTATPSIMFEQMSQHPMVHTQGFSCPITDVHVLRPLHILSLPPGMVSSYIRRNSILGALVFFFSNFIYFDCSRSSKLHGLFSSCEERGLVSRGGVQVSHCGGFSCCRA